MTDADGAALVLDNYVQTAGVAPPTTAIRKLVAWLSSQPNSDVFVTNSLRDDLPWAEDLKETASGLLAIRISDVRDRYILWFRQEIVRTVKWAGQPVKGVDEHQRLHPHGVQQKWDQHATSAQR